MNYHIDTGLILTAFKKDCECPLCEIFKTVEKQIVSQFANEAVTSDDHRKLVNEKGFCVRHFKQLLSADNKLGIALQTHTRLKYLANITQQKIKPVKTAKSLKQTLCRCTVCDLIEFNMVRYYKTCAQLYKREAGFEKMIKETKGFCVKHYAELLENSGEAGLKTKEYLKTLFEAFDTNLERISGDLNWFCDKFDFRNADKPWGTSEDALVRSVKKIHGDL